MSTYVYMSILQFTIANRVEKQLATIQFVGACSGVKSADVWYEPLTCCKCNVQYAS